MKLGKHANKRRRATRAPGEPLGPRITARLRGLGATIVRAGRPALKASAAIGVAAMLVGGGLGAWRLVERSPRFAIGEIRLPPLERVTVSDVERALDAKVGQSLLGVRVTAAERAIAALPWVKSVHVRRELPRTLSVEIVERKPVALVALGGPLYLVEKDGVPFKRAQVSETEGLPIITGISRERYRAVPEAAHALVREALTVADAYAQAGSRPRLGEIHAHPLRGFEIEAVPAGGRAVRVYLGKGDLEGKLRRLDQVLGKVGGAGATSVRLDNASRPDRVTVRLASG